MAAKPNGTFRRRLTLRPHALSQANVFYSPAEVALLFGYFDADADPSEELPGGRIYSCLSHDIIAHETTHAILDGTQRHYNKPTNPDVLAFHEGFADLAALLQHFSLTDILEHEIIRTRGDLEAESVIGRKARSHHDHSGSGLLASSRHNLLRIPSRTHEFLYLNDRKDRFKREAKQLRALKQQFLDAFRKTPDFAHELGLNPDQSFDVEELRNAMRFGPDGQSIPQVLISLTQTVTILWAEFESPGGSSLIIDLTVPAVRYCVSKSVDNASTRKRTSEFLAEAGKDRCGRSSLSLIPAVHSRHYTSSHERFNVLRRSKLIKPVAQLPAEDGGRRIGAPWRQLHLIRSKPRVQT